MHETYRMLGKEREADFERDADKFRRASELPSRRKRRRAPVPTLERPRSRLRTALARLVGA
jgi:hypothetical protein